MDTSPQIDPNTTASLLTFMGLAIDETKLVRSIKISKEKARELQTDDPSSHRLIFIKREISNLKVRLMQVRNQAKK